MSDKLNEAKKLLLNKQFKLKGNSGFINYVTDVTFDQIKDDILIGYKTINHNKDTAGSMTLSEFIGKHII